MWCDEKDRVSELLLFCVCIGEEKKNTDTEKIIRVWTKFYIDRIFLTFVTYILFAVTMLIAATVAVVIAAGVVVNGIFTTRV